MAITTLLVLSLCLPMVALPLSVEGGSSSAISSVDVCDDDPTEILYGELFIAEDFYSNLNFLAASLLEIKNERNDAAALATRLERPPVK